MRLIICHELLSLFFLFSAHLRVMLRYLARRITDGYTKTPDICWGAPGQFKMDFRSPEEASPSENAALGKFRVN
jgi:hypothetical protein